ncbi:PHP domain-containing protein [Paenibacillus sp. GCM10027628]|uniref:PHP domain-containing protein n=1 Tax=Paenibacillus sp. GCM10027628 TaxID=3273413 RepID=UPI00362FA866
MKVDFHFHLEEGPYSLGWMQRTARALENMYSGKAQLNEDPHKLEWAQQMVALMNRRMEQGCFHEEWFGHYFALGRERGIEHFGIVDHGYRFTEFRAYYEKHMIVDDTPLGRLQRYWLDRVCIGSIEPYIDAVKKAQQAGYPVSLGLEADYFPGGENELRELLAPYDFDYVIGSVHFLDGWGFDNPETEDLFKEKDLPALYRQLFDTVKGAAASGLFDIVAHLDNLKVFGYRPDESLLLPMYEDVAQALKAADVATEINTGLAYRYPVKEACPSPAFLRMLRKHEVPLTLSSDSHFPDDIGMMLDEASELLKQSGYADIVYFKYRKRIVTAL